MRFNKFMHPRNRYKAPLDFKKLAIEYPEFAKYCKINLSGKVHYDFADRNAVMELTKLLLKNDFNLDVYLPPETLVPCIPQRLNYILWIEDIFANLEIKMKLLGIDIGCGASCVFSLMMARMYEWRMLGTDISEDNVIIANENIAKNNLQHLITVRQVTPSCYLMDAVADKQCYDFCVCNPPFFDSESDLDVKLKSRSDTRKAPLTNNQSVSKREVITAGGEVQFIKGIMADSAVLQDRVKVYSTMIGHKKSLQPLLEELTRLNAKSVARAEFCQGNTIRWGLAWSFSLPNLHNFLPITNERKRKPMEFSFKGTADTAEKCFSSINDLLNKFQIKYKSIFRDVDVYMLTLQAYENTWVSERQKRKKANRLQRERLKRLRLEAGCVDRTAEDDNDDGNVTNNKTVLAETLSTSQPREKAEKIKEEDGISAEIPGNDASQIDSTATDGSAVECNGGGSVKRKFSAMGSCCDLLLKVDLTIHFSDVTEEISIQATTLVGEKTLTAQILQIFRNHL